MAMVMNGFALMSVSFHSCCGFPLSHVSRCHFFELLFLTKEYVFMTMVLAMVMKVIYSLSTHCVDGTENKH